MVRDMTTTEKMVEATVLLMQSYVAMVEADEPTKIEGVSLTAVVVHMNTLLMARSDYSEEQSERVFWGGKVKESRNG